MAEKIIQFGTREISYRLHRCARKRLRIVVSPELVVDIYAPDTATDSEIAAVIEKKAAWIAKTLDKVEGYHPIPVPIRYIDGETIVYLGRQYRLKIDIGVSRPAKLLGRFLDVQVPDKKDNKKVKQMVDAWYRERAKDVFARYLTKCREITSRHNIPEPTLTVRSMRRRWGSCSPAGRITLNLRLIQVPVHCIEYVIMHELCHMKYHNHSKSFYGLLTRCMPDWKQRKQYLSSLGFS
jgi:predicted metal-dependent hydrolase